MLALRISAGFILSVKGFPKEEREAPVAGRAAGHSDQQCTEIRTWTLLRETSEWLPESAKRNNQCLWSPDSTANHGSPSVIIKCQRLENGELVRWKLNKHQPLREAKRSVNIRNGCVLGIHRAMAYDFFFFLNIPWQASNALKMRTWNRLWA